MAINFGGTLYAWNSGKTIALFVVSGLLLLAFAIQQSFCLFTNPQGRIFPIHFLKMKEPVLLFILMAANNAAQVIMLYYLPLYFQFTKGVGSLNSAVKLLPLIFAVTVAIMANGAIMSKFGYYFPWYLGGSILILIGGALVSRIDINTPISRVYGYEVLVGVGLGCYLQAGYAVIQGVLDPSQMSYAVTFMLLGQLLGISISLSVAGAVFVNTSLHGLQQILPNIPKQQLQSIISGASGTLFHTLSPTMQAQALVIIVASLQKMFILVYVAGAVSLVTGVFLSRKKLNLGPAAGA